jgi:hypothetical protein
MLENMFAELYNVKYQRYMHREFGGGGGFGSPLTIRELFVFETTPKMNLEIKNLSTQNDKFLKLNFEI